MLTARADEVDTIVGLDAGADDYVTKPFRLAEPARPHPGAAAPQRTRRRAAGRPQGVRIDPVSHRAWVNDEELQLTAEGVRPARGAAARRRQGRDPRAAHARGVGHRPGGAPRRRSTCTCRGCAEAQRRRHQPAVHLDRAWGRLPLRTRLLSAVRAPTRPAVDGRGGRRRRRAAARCAAGGRGASSVARQTPSGTPSREPTASAAASTPGLDAGARVTDRPAARAYRRPSVTTPRCSCRRPESTALSSEDGPAERAIKGARSATTGPGRRSSAESRLGRPDHARAAALAVLVVALVAIAVAGCSLGLRQANRLVRAARRPGPHAPSGSAPGTPSPASPGTTCEEVDRVADVAGAQRRAHERHARRRAPVRRATPPPAAHPAHRAVDAAGGDRRHRRHARRCARRPGSPWTRWSGWPPSSTTCSPRARKQRAATSAGPLLVDDVLAQQVEEWEPAVRRRRPPRSGAVGTPGLACGPPPGHSPRSLATLLENSLVHGAGTVTVRTRWSGGSVVVEVARRGPRRARRSWPRGLRALRQQQPRAPAWAWRWPATSLAADGGRLELLRTRPPVFAVFLGDADSSGGAGEHQRAVGPEAERRPQRQPDDVGGDVVRDG